MSDKGSDKELSTLWYSSNQSLWDAALDNYWNYVKPSNYNLEQKMEDLDWRFVSQLDVEGFFSFLYEEYFVWKYTAPNRLATTRIQLSKYKTDNRMYELKVIKDQLFSFDLNEIEIGLQIARHINGLGVSGASGLLSLLFPVNFGTVDQFAVKAMRSIENLPELNQLFHMNPESLTISNGVLLINIMKKKAAEINCFNNTDYWTPRKIDKVLWTYGR